MVRQPLLSGNPKSTNTYNLTLMGNNANQIQPIQDLDHDKENVRLEEEGALCKPDNGAKANAEKKQGKSEEYKFSEIDIVAEIHPKVLQLGSIGGPLSTALNEKDLKYKETKNPIENSIIWRMNPPERMSQHSTLKTNIHYILLMYDDAGEFCNSVHDGSLMDHISSVRKHYLSYTICCLTNRLMSFINEREQQKYKNRKEASNWKRPPVEKVFAKLATQFANVHSRQCVDESEVAEYIVGLTINLAKCYSRKKLTHLSVNANGYNVPKDRVNRQLIMKHP